MGASMSRKDEILAVKDLGERIGYGNLMDLASALWTIQESDENDTTIMHVPTVESCMKAKDWKQKRKEVLIRVDEILSELK